MGNRFSLLWIVILFFLLLAFSFKAFSEAPTVIQITPATGPTVGGTPVVITGTGFTSESAVTIGGNIATDITFVSSTEIHATTPAGNQGEQDVVVINSDGHSGRLAKGFAYEVETILLGSEFRVNTYTTRDQFLSSVGVDAGGNFVIVWESNGQDGDGRGVYAQRYDADGTPLGEEFLVNTKTDGSQHLPSVGMSTSGNFVIAWDDSCSTIYAQCYDSNGVRLGDEFQFRQDAAPLQYGPQVEINESGNFIIVWVANYDDRGGRERDIYARKFSADGTPLGEAFLVNTYTLKDQEKPAIGMSRDGDFVIAWQSYQQDGNEGIGIYAQRYTADGIPAEGEFKVSISISYQSYPSVGMDATGNFVIAWRGEELDGSSKGIYAKRYASDGTPMDEEFQVTVDVNMRVSVEMDTAGNFIIVWDKGGVDSGIYAQRYAADGTPLGREFRVNTLTDGSTHYYPAVGVDAIGNFVVTWTTHCSQGLNGYDIYAQRLDGGLASILSLTQVSPGSDSIAGGTLITLTGTYFQEGATVTIGGIPATNVAVVSETEITAITPVSSDAGVFDVVVTNPDGRFAILPYGFYRRLLPPSNLQATAVSDSQIDLTWDSDADNKEGLYLERKKAGDDFQQIAIIEANQNSYNDTGLEEYTTYTYRIYAYKGNSISEYSNEVTVTTLKKIPNVPNNLNATPIAQTQMRLTWTDNAYNEEGFHLERKKSGESFQPVADITDDETTYTDTRLQADMTYTYRIRAYNSRGNSEYSNEATATTLKFPPKAPTHLVAIGVESNQINLFWIDNATNEDRFIIERKIDGGNYQAIQTIPANTTIYNDTGLDAQTIYHYRIKSFNNGGSSEYSNEVRSKTLKPPPSAPTNLVADAVSTRQINLTWTDNAQSEDGFILERKQSGEDFQRIATLPSDKESYQDTDVQPERTYIYRIKAYNSSGNSPYSNEVQVTTSVLPSRQFSISQFSGAPEAEVTVPIQIDSVDNLLSVEFQLKYAPDILTAGDAQPTNLTTEWLIMSHINSPGMMRIGLTTSEPGSGGGPLTEIPFTVSASAPDYAQSPLTLTQVVINNGEILGETTSGTFTVRVPTIPQAPLNLTLNVIGTTAELRWVDNANNETGFRIERKKGIDSTYTQIGTVGANATSYQDTGLTPDTLYIYRVTAYNSVGDSDHSNEAPTPPIPGEVSLNGMLSGYDAALVLRYLAGTYPLSTQQLQSSNVSGDELVTTDDAELILQRWTEIISQFSVENFSVTESGQTVTVSIPNVEGHQGQTVPASILIDDVTGMFHLDITLTYNPALATPTAVEKAVPISNWFIASNVINPGTLKISIAGSVPPTSNGGLISISFEIATQANVNDQTPLTIAFTLINEGEISSTEANGTLTVINANPAISPTVPDITTNEDEITTLQLTPYEQDIEDTNTGLTWSIHDVNETLFSVSLETATDTLTITPVPDASGNDNVTLTLTDSHGGTATQVITVTIQEVNDTPQVTNLTASATEIFRGQSMQIQSTGSDVEDMLSQLTVEIEYRPPGGNWTAMDGETFVIDRWEVAFSPAASVVLGEYDFRVRYRDTAGGESGWLEANGLVTVKNNPPQAEAGGPYNGYSGVEITFQGEGSDVENTTLTYEWDFNEDSVYDDATGESVSHTYEQPGTFTISLRVTDADGTKATNSAIVTIDAAPSLQLLSYDAKAGDSSGNFIARVKDANPNTEYDITIYHHTDINYLQDSKIVTTDSAGTASARLWSRCYGATNPTYFVVAELSRDGLVAESNRLYCSKLIGIAATDTEDKNNQGNDDEIYYIGQEIKIWAQDKDSQTNLTGTISISSITAGYQSDAQIPHQGDGIYSYIWDTTNLSPATDYRVEVTLSNSNGGLSGVDYLIRLINKVTLKGRAMWTWGETIGNENPQNWAIVTNGDYDNDSKGDRDELFDLCNQVSFRITTIYFSVHPHLSKDGITLSDAQALREFLMTAHNAGLRVECLAGTHEWIEDKLQEGKDYFDAVLEFNQTASHQERFDGIHYDVEHDSWNESRWNNFIELINYCRSEINSYNLSHPVEESIIFGVDTDPTRFLNGLESSGQVMSNYDVLNIVDYITILDYRDYAYFNPDIPSRTDGLIHWAEPVIADATELNKGVHIGVELGTDNVYYEFVTFNEESLLYMETELLKVAEYFSDESLHPAYQGIALHDYNNYSAKVEQVTPSKVVDLTGSPQIASNSLTLSWSSSENALSYNIYRSTSPNDLSGMARNQCRIATQITDQDFSQEGIQWTDTGVIADPTTNYFYVVTAVNEVDIESLSSDIVGEFDFQLHTTPDTNYTWITIPLTLDNVTTAEELADFIGDICISVGKFDSLNQSYITHIHGTPLFNFPVEVGQPYRIQASEEVIITLTGQIMSEPKFTLRTTPDTNYTWITLPFSKHNITTAEELADDIGDKCISMGVFDPQTQSYITHIHGTPLFNFSVRPGYPYRIQVSGEIEWP